MLPVQPQPEGRSERIVTLSASPGFAPSIQTGPVTGLTRARSSLSRSAAVDVFVSWPDDASTVSNCTLSPGAMLQARRERVVPAVVDVVAVDGVAGEFAHGAGS